LSTFDKEAFTRAQHIDRLRDRGLEFDDADMERVLKVVSYYRLSGYLFPFKSVSGDTYASGTTLKEVWRIYTFDRQLRLLVLDAIERFEIGVRADLFDRLALQTGVFGYLDPASFPHMSGRDFSRLLSGIAREFDRSKADFVDHFKTAYGDAHKFPPYWIAAELLTLGDLVSVYRGSSRSIRRDVALRYGVREDVLESWLLTANTVRNICAHHGRLWNRVIGTEPKLPPQSASSKWYEPVAIPGRKVFTTLSILRHVVSVCAPNSEWPTRLADLFARYPEIRKGMMGFPEGWEASPVWSAPPLAAIAGAVEPLPGEPAEQALPADSGSR
jgi:abortive infection bacteriophage resistance protein